MTTAELAGLIELLRAQGVTKYSTPELTLELLPAPRAVEVAEAEPRVSAPATSGLDPRVADALRRLPPSYRDPALWKLGAE